MTFLTTEEVHDVDRMFKKYMGASTNNMYAHLGEVAYVYSLLRMGIAYHHAGMLRELRELIEIMMKEKLVKLLFATETLGIGVNVPAKTVVFTQLEKYDGKFRPLITSEYRQIAGRAGRRGLDTFGTVMIVPLHQFPDESTFRGIVDGRNPDIRSNFKLDYPTILLIAQNPTLSFDSFFSKSLKKFELEQINEPLRKTKISLTDHLQQLTPSLSAIAATIPQSTLDKILKYIQYEEKTKNMRAACNVTTVTFAKNKDMDAIKRMIANTKEYKEYYTLSTQIRETEATLASVESDIDANETLFYTQFAKLRDAMISLNYLTESAIETFELTPQHITKRGVICSLVNDCNVVLLTHVVDSHCLANLTAVEIVGLIALFADPIKRDDEMSITPNFPKYPVLQERIVDLASVAEQLETLEHTMISPADAGDYTLNYDFVGGAIMWAENHTIKDVMEFFDGYAMSTELFRKNMIKISNIILAVIRIYKVISTDVEVLQVLEKANDLIMRDIVCTTSLYLRTQ